MKPTTERGRPSQTLRTQSGPKVSTNRSAIAVSVARHEKTAGAECARAERKEGQVARGQGNGLRGEMLYTALYNPLILQAVDRCHFTKFCNEISGFTRTLTPLI
jgi:hypothetical protein